MKYKRQEVETTAETNRMKKNTKTPKKRFGIQQLHDAEASSGSNKTFSWQKEK